ncbi:hypothetical protein [Flavobacterium koreense]
MVFGCFFQSGFSQVGINTSTPMSTLDINGNLTIKEVGIVNSNVAGSAVFTGGSPSNRRLINDGVYISLTPVATSGTNGPDFILPNAVDVPGRIYILRNISNSQTAYLFSTAPSDLYAKDSSGPTAQPINMPPNALFKTLIVISDGENWTYIF